MVKCDSGVAGARNNIPTLHSLPNFGCTVLEAILGFPTARNRAADTRRYLRSPWSDKEQLGASVDSNAQV